MGSIDVLLNTAGVLDAYKTLEETNFAEWQRILSTNLNSMYLMISAFLPKMKAQKYRSNYQYGFGCWLDCRWWWRRLYGQ